MPSHGPPSLYTVKGRGFYDCKEINDLAALLAAIDDPQNPLELAAALRSPLFGLSDQCLLEIALHLHEEGVGLKRLRKLWELFNDVEEDSRGSLSNARRRLTPGTRCSRSARCASALR